MNEEKWKIICGFEDYEVSDMGRIRCIKLGNERIEKTYFNAYGYLILTLRNGRKKISKSVHQLVAIAFLDHKPNGYKFVVDHINSIKTDNRVLNLQIITQRENLSKDKTRISKYTGVCKSKEGNRWRSRIMVNKKNISLGSFSTQEEARDAYLRALNNLKP